MRSVGLAFVTMCALALLLFSGNIEAELVDGTDIIAPPPNVLDDGTTNTNQQAFNEKQAVNLQRSVQCDNTTLDQGQQVSSHMIFLNSSGDTEIGITEATWSFNEPIVCVMSDNQGSLEIASTDLLGNETTTYPTSGFEERGLEPADGDGYKVGADQRSITVEMGVSEPGDWIRVVTKRSDGIPTLGQWGLALLTLLVFTILLWQIQRRSRRQVTPSASD